MWNVIKMAPLIKICTTKYETIQNEKKSGGLVRDLNPGPLAP